MQTSGRKAARLANERRKLRRRFRKVEWYNGSHDHHYNGWYSLDSPGIDLVAQGESDNDYTNQISLRSIGADAEVVVHADSGVRITTGGPEISKDLHDRDLEGFRRWKWIRAKEFPCIDGPNSNTLAPVSR